MGNHQGRPQPIGSDAAITQGTPAYCTATHDVGRLGLLISNGGIFGAPSFIVDGQLFWGQDRLDFVHEALLA